jgi:hypothetical protein
MANIPVNSAHLIDANASNRAAKATINAAVQAGIATDTINDRYHRRSERQGDLSRERQGPGELVRARLAGKSRRAKCKCTKKAACRWSAMAPPGSVPSATAEAFTNARIRHDAGDQARTSRPDLSEALIRRYQAVENGTLADLRARPKPWVNAREPALLSFCRPGIPRSIPLAQLGKSAIVRSILSLSGSAEGWFCTGPRGKKGVCPVFVQGC